MTARVWVYAWVCAVCYPYIFGTLARQLLAERYGEAEITVRD